MKITNIKNNVEQPKNDQNISNFIPLYLMIWFDIIRNA
jgi:hypothetical protein